MPRIHPQNDIIMAPDYARLCDEALEASTKDENSSSHIKKLEKAFAQTQSVQAQIEIASTLGQLLLQKSKKNQAATYLQKALHLHEIFSDNHWADKGVLHNRLALALSDKQPEKAEKHYLSAFKIFEDLSGEQKRFFPHCGNTLVALADLYYKTNQRDRAVPNYQRALTFFSVSDTGAYAAMAHCHFQLGDAAKDKFNLLEAKNQFKEAALLYKKLMDTNLNYEPMLAAAYNNVSICFKDLQMYDEALTYYQKTLALYTNLSEDMAGYIPHAAATYNAIAMVYAEKKDYKNALKNERQARRIYEFLADETPEKYLHYWATAYHNCGIYALENKQLSKAEKYLTKAYSLRKKLAVKQENFIADTCVTGLNLVELYSIWEREDGTSYKEFIENLLSELKDYIESLDETLAVFGSLKNDYEYYKNQI